MLSLCLIFSFYMVKRNLFSSTFIFFCLIFKKEYKIELKPE